MLLIVMCALLLIRGASESAKVNTIMVIIKLGVLALFVAIAFTAFTTDHFAGFWDKGFAGITAGAATIFFTFIGLDAVSTAGDEVKNPQKTMPRAIIAALIVVTTIYILVAFAGLGTQEAEAFGSEEQSEAGLVGHPGECSRRLDLGQHDPRRRSGDLDLLGHARGDVRPDPHPVRDGPRRAASVDVRQGQPAQHDTGEQHDHRGRRHGAPGRLRPLDYLWDLVSIGTLVAFITVSIGVIILRVREPDLPRGFKVPGYPVTPILSVARLRMDPVRPAPVHLDLVRDMGGRGAELLLPLEPTPQRAERRRRRPHPHRGAGTTRYEVLDAAEGSAVTVAVGYLAGKGGRSRAAPRRRSGEDTEDIADRRHRRAQAVDDSVARAHRCRIRPVRRAVGARTRPTRGTASASSSIADGLEVSFHKFAHRSAPGGLLEAVEELEAEALVLGSAADGKLGQVVIGSTADRLLHSSPVPLAISPRGYRGSQVRRADPAHVRLSRHSRVASTSWNASQRWRNELDVPMRVITFAVRGRTMYPPEVGLHAEDSILEALGDAGCERRWRKLKTDGVVGDDVDAAGRHRQRLG